MITPEISGGEFTGIRRFDVPRAMSYYRKKWRIASRLYKY